MSFELGSRREEPGGTPRSTTLAVVIEGQRLAAGLVDTEGSVVVRDRIASPSRDVWQGLERLIGRVLAAAPSGTVPPSAVAVTCSGPIDTRAGSVSSPQIASWSNFPLRERLADLTSLPVLLDTVAGASADMRATAASEPRTDFLEVLLGPSIDSACVVAGMRLSGAHGNAGSLAHLIVEPDGNACWCGDNGCLEAYVASVAIESELNRPLQRATPSIIERTGIMFGRAVSSIAATVDISTVYVSGVVVDTFGQPMLEAARAEVKTRSRLPNLAQLAIILSSPAPPLVAAASLAGAGGGEWLTSVADG